MIAFGAAIADRRDYERIALPGIERAAEPDSVVLTRTGMTIWRAYDEIMDEAAALPGLESLVLLHQDLELTDASLPARAPAPGRDRRRAALGPGPAARRVGAGLPSLSRPPVGTRANRHARKSRRRDLREKREPTA